MSLLGYQAEDEDQKIKELDAEISKCSGSIASREEELSTLKQRHTYLQVQLAFSLASGSLAGVHVTGC